MERNSVSRQPQAIEMRPITHFGFGEGNMALKIEENKIEAK